MLGFCILSSIASLMLFVAPAICPSILAFVAYLMLQYGSVDFSMCPLYLFPPLFIICIDTFIQFMKKKISGSAISIYVCSFGRISLLSLYSIFASSA